MANNVLHVQHLIASVMDRPEDFVLEHIYNGLKYSIEGFCVCLCVMSQELYLK